MADPLVNRCSTPSQDTPAPSVERPVAEPTPRPWEYVPSTEHHGPYIVSEFGSTIADLYTMTLPNEPSTRNGGPSRPVPFLAEIKRPKWSSHDYIALLITRVRSHASTSWAQSSVRARISLGG